jgi:hypothetical protein
MRIGLTDVDVHYFFCKITKKYAQNRRIFYFIYYFCKINNLIVESKGIY